MQESYETSPDGNLFTQFLKQIRCVRVEVNGERDNKADMLYLSFGRKHHVDFGLRNLREWRKVPAWLNKISNCLLFFNAHSDLQGNNITSISAHDLQRLGRLRVLQLTNNKIEHIDAGAFNDLVLLERL